jgi:hypothetical protein
MTSSVPFGPVPENGTDVIRSGLRLLEAHETRREALRHALVEGEESGVVGRLDMEKIKRQARELPRGQPRGYTAFRQVMTSTV